ncbi:MAG: hypothetical protein IRZ00_02885 [Gemmatimonadetes bacterium]|nr:hypothetical protein [Gemmatimonadota bacterium]
MSTRILLAAWLLAGAPLAARASAQEPARGWATSIELAVVRSSAGDFAAAARLLRGALAACAAASEGRGCRRGVNYSLGYIYQVKSRRDPAGRDSLLARAAEFYRAALAIDSSDAAAVYNLALVYRDAPPDPAHEAFLRDAARRARRRPAVRLSSRGTRPSGRGAVCRRAGRRLRRL